MKKLFLVLFFAHSTLSLFSADRIYSFTVDNLSYKYGESGEVSVCPRTVTYETLGTRYEPTLTDYKLQYLVIPEYVEYNGVSYKVTGIEDHAFDYGRTKSPLMIKSITIPSTVKVIGEGAFRCCNCPIFCSAEIPAQIDKTALSNYEGFCIYTLPHLVKTYKEAWNTRKCYPIVSNMFIDNVSVGTYLESLAGTDRSVVTSVGLYGGVVDEMLEFILKEGMNPNCLYLLPSNTNLGGENIVKYDLATADIVKFDKNYNCSNPLEINVNEVELSFTPSVWADGQSGWEVITLPFEPTSIEASVSGSIVPITTNSTGNFWLRQYVGSSDDAVYFASTADGVMKANTPYLIAFPGDKMGKGSLEGQTITFKAKNVTIPVTTIPSIQKNGYTFVGNYDTTADEGGGWTLNAEGSAFVWSETVGDKPFSAYFKGEAPAAGASALRMSFGQMDNATGLEQNMADLIDHADETVYTLDGRKVNTKDLKPGLYIKNHKKMMVR